MLIACWRLVMFHPHEPVYGYHFLIVNIVTAPTTSSALVRWFQILALEPFEILLAGAFALGARGSGCEIETHRKTSYVR